MSRESILFVEILAYRLKQRHEGGGSPALKKIYKEQAKILKKKGVRRKMKKWFVLALMLVLVMIPGVAMADYTEDLVPEMTSSTTPSGEVIFNTEYTAYHNYAFLAFDYDVTSGWIPEYYDISSSKPIWIGYDFGSAKRISQYTLTFGEVSSNRTPKDWTFEGWDGSQWVVLDTRTGVNSGWENDVPRTFTFSSNTGYNKYRIYITGVNSTDGVYMLNFEMMEEVVTNSSNIDIDTASTTVQGDTQFVANVIINNASNLYAEDVTIGYDANLFEFVSAEPANTGMQIYYQETSTPGSARFIVASKGEEYGINGNGQQILKLTFKSKNIAGTGRIEAVSGLVADNNGTETVATVSGKDITVVEMDADVNSDGRYSLGDLAITSFNFSKDSTAWTNLKVDVDKNNAVDDTDLTLIVQKILTQA